MRIVVTGATGFIGRVLVSFLKKEGHALVVISRKPESARQNLGIEEAYTWSQISEAFKQDVDAVVHLAGESVKGYWTKAKVREVWDSRIRTTTSLVEAIQAAAKPPSVVLSASGIGFYGDAGETLLNESSPSGEDYFAQLCVEWERLVMESSSTETRAACLRFGIVLGEGGGALPAMALPAKTGLSGPLGTGKQWWSWVALEDAVAALLHVLHSDALEGPVNVVAPEPIRQAEFQQIMCKAMSRPAFLPAPAFGVRLILGKFADEVLSSKRVQPSKLVENGFTWSDGELEPLMQRLFAQ